MKKKKMRINKRKFIPRVGLLVLILILIIISINSSSKNEEISVIKPKLIVDTVDVTDNLVHDIYIDKSNMLYMSIDDIKNIFDKNLYFEEDTGKVITTCGTKTAAIDINNNTMEVNSASLLLENSIMKFENIVYIPASEITNIYNIEVKCTENSAVVLSLYKALTTVSANKNISLKEDTGLFSKSLQKIEKGQELVFIENADNNAWYKVLTYEGNIGFVKIKEVSEKKQIRINMEDSDFSSKEPDLDNSIELTYRSLKTDNLKDFSSRKKIVDDTISSIISKEKYTVKLNHSKVEVESKYLERFIIELIPRLKEIGASLAVVNNEDILNEKFLRDMNLI